MQIRYKITFTYSITVGIILMILCSCIYFFSAQERIGQYRERLKARALNIHKLYTTERLDPDLLKKIAQFPSAALYQKSLQIYDTAARIVFTNNDADAPPLEVTPGFVKRVREGKEVFFSIGRRDALAFRKQGNVVIIAAYDDDRELWLSKLLFILFLSFVISIALVMFIGYVFSLRLIRSISLISDEVNHISSQDLSLRLETNDSKDELAELAATINRLLSRLQYSFETQSRFIDNASHELSTPLAVILGQLDIAKQKGRSKEEYEAVIDSVYEDVSSLNILVKSLLDLAKLSGSQNGLELSTFRIDDLLMQLPASMKKINPAYKVKLLFEEFPEDEEEMKVYGNPPLLLCAFHNIVHNACKYAPDHAAIVKLVFDNKSIRITIQDYGPGIDEKDIPYIFQPFYRSSNFNATIQGTGLGLPLAKNILKLHNGMITMNTEKGIGTTFLIEIKQKNV